MNEKLLPIFRRRSIRAYTDKAVPDDIIKDLLAAGMAAPSAVAKDPWEFIIVRDQAVLSRIADELPNGKMLAKAPLGIVVCGDSQRSHDGQLSYLLQDCSAAIENILLATSMLGLGACWLGVHPREERMRHLRAIFDLPEAVLPVAVLAVGWPAERKEPRTRYCDQYAHYEKW